MFLTIQFGIFNFPFPIKKREDLKYTSNFTCWFYGGETWFLTLREENKLSV